MCRQSGLLLLEGGASADVLQNLSGRRVGNRRFYCVGVLGMEIGSL